MSTNRTKKHSQMLVGLCAITLLATVLGACAGTPEPATEPSVELPPLDGRRIWESYRGGETFYEWSESGRSGTFAVSAEFAEGNELRIRVRGAGESDVGRDAYDTGQDVVFGFFGRISGVAHLFFALHLPQEAEVGAEWSANRLYGDNQAHYLIEAIELVRLPDGTEVGAYRISVEIDSDRADLSGAGSYLVVPGIGIAEIIYSSRDGDVRVALTDERSVSDQNRDGAGRDRGRDERRLAGAPSSFYEVIPFHGQRDAPVYADLHLAFYADVDLDDVARSFSIAPSVEYEIVVRPFTSTSDSIITIELADLQPNTSYSAVFRRGIRIGQEQTTEDLRIEFTTGEGRLDSIPTIPGRPIIVEPAPMGTPLRFLLAWEGIEDAEEYEVQEARGVGFLNPDRMWETAETEIEIEASRPNEWYYRVRGVAADGSTSAWSPIYFVGAGK